MANQNFRVGVSVDLTAARSSLRRLESEFQNIDIEFKNIERSSAGLRELAKAVKTVDNAFARLDPQQRANNFRSLADGVETLRRALASTDDDASKLSREIRDLADASRSADRAVTNLGQAQRRTARSGSGLTAIGPGGVVNRSGGRPFGFLGAQGPLGFLGIGGVGAGAALGAGVIAAISAIGFAAVSAATSVGRFVGATAELTAEFDRLIRTANVLAGGGALGVFSDAALEQGARTIFTANEAAEALGELARAGFDTEEAIGALPGVLDLAAIEQTNLADTTLIVARTLRAFQLDAEAAGLVADVLAETSAASATSVTELANGLKFVAPIASQLEIPLQEVAAAMGVLGDNGIVATIAGTNLRFALNSLLAPTEPAKAAMEELGLVITDAAGNFVGLEAIITQLVSAQDRIADNAQFNALIVEAFGTRASGAILTLVENSDLLGSRIDENFRAFGRAAEIANEQLAGLAGALERLRGEFEAQQITSFRLTGLQDSLTAIVGVAEDALPGLFEGIVDPIFESIAVGASLVRTQVFPTLIDAAPDFGEIFGDSIDAVFNFISTNSEFVVDSLELVAIAAQGVVDVFLGIGAVAETVLGPVISLFNDLNDVVQSVVVGGVAGGGLGAFIGGIIGAVGGPGGAIAGAGIGAAIGSVVAAIGTGFGEADIPRQAAEFGVELGTAVNEGVIDGLDITGALDQALRDIDFGVDVSGFADLISETDEVQQKVNDLRRTISTIPEPSSVLVSSTAAVTARATLKSLNDVLEDETATLEINMAKMAEILALPDVANIIEQEIARAEAVVEDFQSRGIFDFSVTQDRAAILQRIGEGHPLAALTEATEVERGLFREQAAVSADDADRILREFTDSVIDSAGTQAQRIAAEVAPEILATIEVLEGFSAAIAQTLTDMGTSFIPHEFAIPDPLEFLREDFTDVFTPPSAEAAEALAEEAATEAEKFIEPSIASARAALIAKLRELPDSIRRDQAFANVRDIFREGDLSLFERSLAGAFVVDQAFLEEEARKATRQLETVFTRIQELLAESGTADRLANLAPSLPDEDQLGIGAFLEDSAARTQALRDQAGVLAELVASGQTVLANALATSDTTLQSVTTAFDQVDGVRERLQAISDEAGVEIGILLSDQSVLDAQADFAALGVELDETATEIGGSSGESISSALDTATAGIPDIISGRFTDAIGSVNEVLDSGSPSVVFIHIGDDMAAGLRIGWETGFNLFRNNVISDFTELLATIRSMAANFTLPPIGGAGGSSFIPENAFHGGGMVGGRGEQLARVLSGEFMLRRGAVSTLSAMGVSLDLLNRNPRAFFPDYHASAQTSNQTTYDHRNQGTNVTHNWEIKGAPSTLNERKIIREAEKRLVRSVRGRIR